MSGSLSLGLSLVNANLFAGAAVPAWVPPGAVFALDFTQGRYWSGQSRQLSDLTTFARSGAALAYDGAGYANFASDVPRLADGVLNYEPARTNLNPRLKDVNANWVTNGGTASLYGSTALTIFDNGVTHASAGALANRRESTSFALTAGETYAVTVWYHPGTSPTAYVFCRGTNYGGYYGPADALDTPSTSGGTVSDLEQVDLAGGVIKASFLFVPSTTMSHRVGAGPYSTIVDQNVTVLGGQVELVGGAMKATSPVMTTGVAVERPAEALTLKLPAAYPSLSLLIDYKNGSQQQISGVSGDYALSALATTYPKIERIYAIAPDGSLILPAAFTGRWALPFRIWAEDEQPDGSLLFRTDLVETSLRPFSPSDADLIFYVDPLTGNDTNPGTEASPFASQYKAVHGRAGDIVVYSRTEVAFDKATSFHGATISGRIMLLPWGDGDVISTMRLPGLVWAPTSGQPNVWEAADDGTAQQVFDASTLTADGSYTLLARQTSVANVNSAAGSHYVNGGKVYVHLAAERAPDAGVMVFSNDPNLQLTQAGSGLYAERHRFEGGSTPAGTNLSSTSQRIDCALIDCEFSYARAASSGSGKENGWNDYSGGDTIMIRCKTRTNYLDGFNYHTYSSLRNTRRAVEIDCESYDNGQQGGGGGANNASTMHDRGTILRLRTVAGRGIYRNAQNRVIHDINDSVVVNLGIDVGPSRAADDTSINFTAGATGVADDMTLMYNFGTISDGSTYDRRTNGVSIIFTASDIADAGDYSGADVQAWTPAFNA